MTRTIRNGSLLALALFFWAGALHAAEAKKGEPKRHRLAATLETTQWGWLDPNEPPKLTVDSGDIVAIETMTHSHNKIQAGVSMEEIIALRKANPGGGPHSVTGPIYVNGAEPGDVMEVRILKINPKPFGFNFNLPGKEFPTIGALAPEFPEGFVRYFNLDLKNQRTEFKPGVVIDLKPFPGRWRSASIPTTRRRARAARRIRWRRSRRCGRGRTARIWT
jgi:acetamidase/formamidase